MNVSLHSRIHITVRALLIGFAMAAVLCTTTWAASEKVLYRFHGTDGDVPASVILGPDGALYGTTVAGGKATKSCDYNGCGVVFRLARGTDGKWHEIVLHDFAGTDGWFPTGSLVADKAGNLYGTTVNGGTTCSQLGCGVIFALLRGKGDKWTFKVLHNFAVTDGANPYAGMIFDLQGNLYGTASSGGNVSACPNEGGCGVVFKLSPDGKGNWTETVVYSFSGADGATPMAPLIFDLASNLYSTTEWGTANASGTVFKLIPGKNGQWSEEVLHSFSFATKDGDEPTYGVVFDSAGNLYGTTQFGGTKNQQGWGTAFRLTPAGGGKWKETILRSFNRDKGPGGGFISSGPILDAKGNVYGSTGAGGKCNNCGAVFKLTPRAKGRWAETVLDSFGKPADGEGPGGGVLFDSAGNLLGVANIGGYTGGSCGQAGCGVVFEITP